MSSTRSRILRDHAPITQNRNRLPRDPKDTEIMHPWDNGQPIPASGNLPYFHVVYVYIWT